MPIVEKGKDLVLYHFYKKFRWFLKCLISANWSLYRVPFYGPFRLPKLNCTDIVTLNLFKEAILLLNFSTLANYSMNCDCPFKNKVGIFSSKINPHFSWKDRSADNAIYWDVVTDNRKWKCHPHIGIHKQHLYKTCSLNVKCAWINLL